jgi:TonB-linked SusC/RagA family outer membrane protein
VTKKGAFDIFLSDQDERNSDSDAPGSFGNILRYKNSSYDFITQEHLKFTAQQSPDLASQGRIAGLNVKQLSGMPGEGGNINIRGISSLFASQNPLVVIDGVAYNTTAFSSKTTDGAFYNLLSTIDVNDVARIEVIKDGSSLYGIEGGQGIVVINTKRPETLTTKIDFSVYSGVTFAPEYLKMMSASEHKTYFVNQMLNTGATFTEIQQKNPWVQGNPSYYYYYNYDNNTNWQDEIFRSANVTKFNANLQGGDEIAKFYVALGYLNQEAVIENAGYQRYNFRFNSDVRILEKLYLNSNVGFTYQISDMKTFGLNSSLNPVSAALLKGPMYAPYLRDNLGNQISILSDTDAEGFSNPSAIVKNNESSAYQSSLLANTKLIYALSGNIKLSTLISVNFNNVKESNFVPNYGVASFNYGEVNNYSSEGMFKMSGISNETKIEYTKELNLKHFLSTQGGFRIISNKENYFQGSVVNTPTDEFKSLSSVTSVEDTYLGGFDRKNNRTDIYIDGGYRYLDKYLFDVVLNLSGSSNIGQESDAIDFIGGKWGFFPSVHAGWVISNESFLKDSKSLELLKLRGSYSVSGNDFNSIYSRYNYNSRTYGSSSGLIRTYIPNQSLKWEQLAQLNIGIDATFFHERMQLSADFYHRKTSDLLTYKETPVTAGFDYFWENNGILTSSGFDLSALIKVLTGEFKFYVGGNLNINNAEVDLSENKVLDIPGGQVIVENGGSAYSFYGLATDGIIQTADEASRLNLENGQGIIFQAGDVKFVDQDNNHIIDELDRVNLGDLFPTLTGGLTFDLSYKGLSLNALFDFSEGNKLFNYTRMQIESFSGYGNQSVAALYSWKKETEFTSFPRTLYGDNVGNSVFSDRWIEDGGMIRLKEITLAYQVPMSKTLKSLIVYATGQNLFTSTDYLGYYPEFAYSANPANQSADYGQIPVTRSIILGIKIGF